MLARGRQSAGQFWWRATEPIPARPEPLADEGASETAPVASPPNGAAPRAPVAAKPMPTVNRPVDHGRDRGAVDLGAYRPTAAAASAHVRPAATRTKPGLQRDVAIKRISGVEGVVGPIPPGAQLALARRRHTLMAAGFAGVVAFAAFTGFGQRVRDADSLAGEIDRLLIAIGFGINEISLTGHRHTADQDVFRALGAGQSTLLTLDVEAARRRVETLPWIETATLVRIFPDKLRVELRERSPSAVWHDGDRTALVDAEGRLLSYVDADAGGVPSRLPHISGEGAPAAAADLWAALVRVPSVASRVRLAHRIGDRRWDIELTNGTRVKLAAGDAAASLERLVRLERNSGSADHAGKVVDLTVPQSVAISTSARGVPRSIARATPGRPM